MLSAIGFILMIILMVVLIKSWVSPPVAFISLPLIAALIAGYSVEQIGGFVGDGMKSMLGTAILFVFSISYFTMMDEIGLFDPIINFLTKKAGMIVVAILLTTFIAHLDGSGATTFLIVVPAFLSIIKRIGFRKEALLAIMCGPYAVMNNFAVGRPHHACRHSSQSGNGRSLCLHHSWCCMPCSADLCEWICRHLYGKAPRSTSGGRDSRAGSSRGRTRFSSHLEILV
ncbi:SLC13 family permease [Caproicibacterium sp. NSD3]